MYACKRRVGLCTVRGFFRKTGEKGNTISVNTETAFHKLEEILESIRRGKDIYGQGRAEISGLCDLWCGSKDMDEGAQGALLAGEVETKT